MIGGNLKIDGVVPIGDITDDFCNGNRKKRLAPIFYTHLPSYGRKFRFAEMKNVIKKECEC